MLKMNSNITNNETEYCQINTERPKQKNNIQLIIPHILPFGKAANRNGTKKNNNEQT